MLDLKHAYSLASVDMVNGLHLDSAFSVTSGHPKRFTIYTYSHTDGGVSNSKAMAFAWLTPPSVCEYVYIDTPSTHPCKGDGLCMDGCLVGALAVFSSEWAVLLLALAAVERRCLALAQVPCSGTPRHSRSSI